MTQKEKAIEIPFGVKDSELLEWVYFIPEGMEAEIKDRKVIIKKAESEDERIREKMIEHFKAKTKETWCNMPVKSILAYLEKQKINTEGDFGRGYDCGYQAGYAVAVNEMKPKVATATLATLATLDSEKQKDPHYTKRNALFDKCVENCDPEVMKRVSDEIDEMLEKEQKPEPVFNVGDKIKLKSESKYPYREIIDIKNGAYYFDGAVCLPFDYQDNWDKEQKPIPANSVGLKEQKPAEWSVEDEEIRLDTIRILETASPVPQRDGKVQLRFSKNILWLKSLRPSWKPSEEQMEALNALNLHGDLSYVGQQNQLISLYNDLKKLI